MEGTDNAKNEGQDKVLKENVSQQAAKCDLDLILDIPLDISVELGRVKILVNDLLQLGQGSVIELDKEISAPVEIYINKKLIARGEVVVMEERFGIRVTDIISPLERVKSLG